MVLLGKLFKTLFVLALGFVLGVGATFYYAATLKAGGKPVGGIPAPASVGVAAVERQAPQRVQQDEMTDDMAMDADDEVMPVAYTPSAATPPARPAGRAGATANVRLLDFGADWCVPCKKQAPILDNLAAQYSGRISVVKIDIDKNPDLAQRYSIRGVPTLILEKNGKIAKRFQGLQDGEVLAAACDAVLR